MLINFVDHNFVHYTLVELWRQQRLKCLHRHYFYPLVKATSRKYGFRTERNTVYAAHPWTFHVCVIHDFMIY
jgi:hypothetical protein